MTKIIENKTFELKVNLFAGKEVLHNVTAISKTFEDLSSNNLQTMHQKIYGISSYDELIGLDESISKELERKLNEIIDPFIRKIAADNVVVIPVETSDEEETIIELSDVLPALKGGASRYGLLSSKALNVI